ncbi:MAG TPA: ABC transporter ATP-binding protein [bacterium]|nr:ABC transporter ATP-binding protein [bacterium]
MAGITLSKVNKKFGDFTAVKDLSLEIGENRVVGFLGPNGAGKTTTIRMMVGLSKPTSGEITIAGQKIVFGDASANSLFGYLPEQPAFYGWMTGEEYIDFIGQTFGFEVSKRKKRINELLALTDLRDARKKRINTYSNGMKQRLGIAQALINQPKVLIMDEPVSALDPIGRRQVLSVIESLKKDMTILLSTHILSDVDRICDDVAIINKGKLITFSPLSELKGKYSTQILEVEFSNDPASIIFELKKESWAGKVEKEGNHLKIWLKDEASVAQNKPLKFFANTQIGVLKYGLSLPEVEDLFIALTEEK